MLSRRVLSIGNIHKLFLLLLLLFSIVPGSTKLSTLNSGHDDEQRVRNFVDAFNRHNTKEMLEKVDENIEWLSVDKSKIATVTRGKAALKEEMDRYFKKCASCKSTLEWVHSAGSRITALERASWNTKSGRVSQQSLSVYEFVNNQIVRVYYFPAERIAK